MALYDVMISDIEYGGKDPRLYKYAKAPIRAEAYLQPYEFPLGKPRWYVAYQ